MSSEQPFGTKEWAKYNLNFINGCSHNCKYCYAKSMAIRFKRKEKGNWQKEELKLKQTKFSKRNGLTMFPSAHDLTPKYLEQGIDLLRKLLAPGNEVLIVSKPHLDCIKRICEEFKENKAQILFRFTIGSADNEVLKFWEPGAPDFKERLNSLKLAYKHGFRTSVSCEPMLDEHISKVVKSVEPYVTDTIWIGKPNMLKSILTVNNHKNALKKADELKEIFSNDFILGLYEQWNDNSKIRWKESIKKVLDRHKLKYK